MIEQEVDILKCNELTDILKKFEEDYLKKMLIKRDEIWHKRKGNFRDEQEQAIYDEVNEKCVFMENLIISCKQILSAIALSGVVMEDLIRTVDKMKLMDDAGSFRNTLFKEQVGEMNRVMAKVQRVYPYVLETCKNN